MTVPYRSVYRDRREVDPPWEPESGREAWSEMRDTGSATRLQGGHENDRDDGKGKDNGAVCLVIGG